MSNLVENYELFDKVVSEYGNNPMYQNEDGTPNMEKIRDEAIGKSTSNSSFASSRI